MVGPLQILKWHQDGTKNRLLLNQLPILKTKTLTRPLEWQSPEVEYLPTPVETGQWELHSGRSPTILTNHYEPQGPDFLPSPVVEWYDEPELLFDMTLE